MYWKLFFTIVAAVLTAALFLRWLRSRGEAQQTAASIRQHREIGFAAIMKANSI